MDLDPRLIPVVLYIGPDVLMPIASALAAVAGILLLFWRKTVEIVRKVGRAIGGVFGRR
jgi:hypothetical protein